MACDQWPARPITTGRRLAGMTRQPDPFAAAEHTARRWLDAVARQLGTDDRHYAHRALRGWLHVVRDRLTVDSAAHFGAQLPELLRGVYYEGWIPGRTPVRYDVEEFTQRYTHEAGISPDDVPFAVAAVSAALQELFSPGQLDHALAPLPQPLRTFLTASLSASEAHARPAGDGRAETDARLRRLEQAVELLTRAVTELAHGLEPNPLDEPDQERGAKAARAVHQLLLTRVSPA